MSLFLGLAATLFTLLTGRVIFMLMAGGVAIAGTVVAVLRDRTGRCVYVLEGDRLILRKGRDEQEIGMASILDASLIGLMAARDYFDQAVREAEEEQSKGPGRDLMASNFIRFSPINVVVGRWTWGIGSRLVDRMSNSRHDLVLLRLTDGVVHLLAPMRAEEFVTAIDRAKQGSRAA